MRAGIKVGDVLSETSHYIVAGLNFDGSIRNLKKQDNEFEGAMAAGVQTCKEI